MTKDEALRLALEALGWTDEWRPQGLKEEAINGIKAALEAKDEPVAWAMLHDNGHFIDAIHPNEHARVEGEYITPLYTTPPQRPWVGLTLEEILETYRGPDGSDYVDYARGIEAKLKEKNNA
jgi:hypothetical protein